MPWWGWVLLAVLSPLAAIGAYAIKFFYDWAKNWRLY